MLPHLVEDTGERREHVGLLEKVSGERVLRADRLADAVGAHGTLVEPPSDTVVVGTDLAEVLGEERDRALAQVAPGVDAEPFHLGGRRRPHAVEARNGRVGYEGGTHLRRHHKEAVGLTMVEPGQAAPKPTRYDLLAASLEEAGRLVSLDWKEDVAEARAWFISLFETAGVGGAEAVELVPRPGESDVDTAHRTFAAFAASHDLRIVTLDADSDMHHFALTTSDRADRWNGVRIGPNQFIGEGRE